MSVFDRCQYRTLVDLANALDLRLPNRRRETIVEALRQTDFIQDDIMALQWQHIADLALEDAATQRGLRFQATDDRAARIAILQAADVTPLDCLRPLLPAQPAAAPAAKVVLQRQLETEHHLGFLDRASMVLDGPALTDREKNRQLLNAAQPGIADVIVQIYGATPAVTFAELVTQLRATFAVQPSTAATRYLQAKPQPNETYVDFGRRIQQLYLQYLGADRTEYQAHSRWITPALILKLFTVTPPAIRGQLQVAYDKDNTIAWTQFCLLADSFVASHPSQRPTGGTNQKPQHSKDLAKTGTMMCAKHGLCSHTTADCRALKSGQQQEQGPRNTGQRRQFNVSNVDYGQAPNDMPTLGHGADPEGGQQ